MHGKLIHYFNTATGFLTANFSFHCIRGHRSSTCGHKNRTLFLVRKRGRPQLNENLRVVIVPGGKGMSEETKDQDQSISGDKNITVGPDSYEMQLVDSKGNTVKVIDPPIVPDLRAQHEATGQGSCCRSSQEYSFDKVQSTNEQVNNGIDVKTEPPGFLASGKNMNRIQKPSSSNARTARLRLRTLKTSQETVPIQEAVAMPTSPAPEDVFVFVPAGNGLYRKERIENLKPNTQFEKGQTVCCVTGRYCPEGCDCGGGVPGSSKSNSNNGFSNSVLSFDYQKINGQLAHANSGLSVPTVIAPMHMNGMVFSDLNALDNSWASPQSTPCTVENGISSTGYMDDNGIAKDDATIEEIVALSKHSSNDGQEISQWLPQSQEPHADITVENPEDVYDIYFAASCVIPGQCECGDDCECYGCSTHNPTAKATAQSGNGKMPSVINP